MNKYINKQLRFLTLVIAKGLVGLALIRIDELREASELTTALVEADSTDGKDDEESRTAVYTFLPKWWPETDPVNGKSVL